MPNAACGGGKMSVMSPRIGAYVLTGDPTWLRSSLTRYYPYLDDLVILVPTDGRGWRGTWIPVEDCLRIVEDVDTRGIARYVQGVWVDRDHPMDADTAQRQAGVDALRDRVDWILQIDNDEILPNPSKLISTLVTLGPDVAAVDWPMRVLFRITRRRVLAVADPQGQPVFEYPGPIAVRPTVILENARRASLQGGMKVRMAVRGDHHSLEMTRPAEENEKRDPSLSATDAIMHNSWGRGPRSVLLKVRSWGHGQGWRSMLYFARVWFPAPVTWRLLRDFHPFARGLWPRLRPLNTPITDLLHPSDIKHKRSRR